MINMNRRQAVGATALATFGLLASSVIPANAIDSSLYDRRNMVINNGKLYLKSKAVDTANHSSVLSFWIKPQWWSNFYARSIARKTGFTYYSAAVAYQRGKAKLYVEKYVNKKQTILHVQDIPAVYNPHIELYTNGDTQEVTLEVRVYDQNTVRPDKPIVSLTDKNNPLQGKETGYSFYISNLNNIPDFYIMDLKHEYTYTDDNSHIDKSLWGNIVFEDTFEGNTIDTTKWRVRDNDYVGYDSGWITKDNVQVSDGALHMSITKRDTPKTTRNGVDANGNTLYKERPYNTSFIDSRGLFSQVYGRWEFRAKIPSSPGVSAGVWGGVWLRPDDRSIEGEVDIAESFGSHNSETKTSLDVSNRTTATIHFSQTGKDKIGKTIPDYGQSLEHEWHTWTFERTPETFKFYFDHKLYQTVNVKDYQAKMDYAFPADKPFGILINMQAGSPGSYWGGINDQTQLPATMHIDYIRAWEYIGK